MAALVSAEDLELLRTDAVVSYSCVACGEAGRVPQRPAAVVILRDGLFSLAKLAHSGCAPSSVYDVPGLQARVLAEAEATTSRVAAAWLPVQGGPVPALLFEPVTRAAVDGDGERVDGLASWMLAHGLHLVAGAAVEPPPAPGWTAALDGAGGLIVTAPAELVYDGTLTADASWRAAVAARGSCVLIAGTGLALDSAPATAGEFVDRLAAVAAAGRLVGGVITARETDPSR
ncbi:hypothetical protein DMB42_52125 [Nonomuraea sp. WAC 01424]|nr:hypothetical protein DMB42_52125 [Nonomuraea sp. WAC 01424]